jgi:hypothetical protein
MDGLMEMFWIRRDGSMSGHRYGGWKGQAECGKSATGT